MLFPLTAMGIRSFMRLPSAIHFSISPATCQGHAAKAVAAFAGVQRRPPLAPEIICASQFAHLQKILNIATIGAGAVSHSWFKLNIAGAAIATMFSNAIAMLYFIGFLLHIRHKSVITLNPRLYSVRQKIPAEVVTVGLPGFVMTMMSTISNTALNHIVAGYSNTAIAGMGIAKKIDLLAYAIAQGMTQGTLPLIGYNTVRVA